MPIVTMVSTAPATVGRILNGLLLSNLMTLLLSPAIQGFIASPAAAKQKPSRAAAREGSSGRIGSLSVNRLHEPSVQRRIASGHLRSRKLVGSMSASLGSLVRKHHCP